jgi:hypothetical protein
MRHQNRLQDLQAVPRLVQNGFPRWLVLVPPQDAAPRSGRQRRELYLSHRQEGARAVASDHCGDGVSMLGPQSHAFTRVPPKRHDVHRISLRRRNGRRGVGFCAHLSGSVHRRPDTREGGAASAGWLWGQASSRRSLPVSTRARARAHSLYIYMVNMCSAACLVLAHAVVLMVFHIQVDCEQHWNDLLAPGSAQQPTGSSLLLSRWHLLAPAAETGRQRPTATATFFPGAFRLWPRRVCFEHVLHNII